MILFFFFESLLLTCSWLEDISSVLLSLEAKHQNVLGLAHNNSDHLLSHLQCASHYTLLPLLYLHAGAFQHHAALSE